MEERQLLSGVERFARAGGSLSNADPTDAIPFAISSDAFNLSAGGTVLLTIQVQASGRGTLDPAAVSVTARDGSATPTILRAREDGTSFRRSTAIVALTPGEYSVRIRGDRGTVGDYFVDWSLAGDANKDFTVDQADIDAIARAVARPPVNPNLGTIDVNLDGRVTRRDRGLANANRGASTSVRPLLPLDLRLDSASDPDGDGLVNDRDIRVVARTTPFRPIQLDINSDGTVDLTQLTDAFGVAVFPISLALDTTLIDAVASDSFGQTSGVTLEVTRRRDLQAPIIRITSPATSGLVTAFPPTIVGQVQDATSPQYRLEAQVDGGPFAPVPVASDGTFRFTPTLASDGTADGAHVVGLRAFDGAGNPSNVAEVRFTLDSSRPQVRLLDADRTFPTAPVLNIEFSEPVGDGAINPDNYLVIVGESGAGQALEVISARRLSDTIVEIVPTSPLTASVYRLRLLAGVTDSAGNPIEGANDLVFRVDPLPPRVVQVNSSAASATANPFIDVVFNEPIAPGSIAVGNFPLTFEGGSRAGQALIASRIESPDGRTVRLFFDGPVPDATYRLTFNALVTDAAGNRIDPPRFVTLAVEGQNPTVTTQVNAVSNQPQGTIGLIFSEAMDASAFVAANYTIQIVGGPNDGQVVPIRRLDRFNELTAVITPERPLANETFRLTVGPGVRDLAGKPLAAPTTFDFRVDTTRPVASTDLAGVSTQAITSFVVNFSEPVNDAAFNLLNYVLVRTSGPANGLPVALARIERLGNQSARVVLASPLATGDYRLDLSDRIRDLAGNVVGVLAPLTFRVDADAPRASLSVAGTLVVPTASFEVRFSEPVGPSALVAGNYELRFAGGPIVPGVAVARVDARTIRVILPAPLPTGSFQLTISPNVTDVVGQGIDPATRVFSFSVNATAPTATVRLSGPQAANSGAVFDGFSVDFSKVMAPSAFFAANYAVTSASGAPVIVTRVIREAGDRAKVEVSPLLSGDSYTLSLSPRITDATGNALVAPLSFTFTVGQASNAAPVAAASVAGTVNERIAGFDLAFSLPVNAAAFDATNYVLVNQDDGRRFAIAGITPINSSLARIELAAPLPDGRYRLEFGTGIASTAGVPLANRSIEFAVDAPEADLVAPTVEALLPAGPITAPTLAFFDVRFSEAVNGAAFEAGTYALQVEVAPNVFQTLPIASVTRLDARTVRITPSVPLSNANYRVVIDAESLDPLRFRTVSRIADLGFNPGTRGANALAGPRTFPIVIRSGAADLTPPSARLGTTGVSTSALTSVDVLFSEAMGTSAFDAGNYAVASTAGVPVGIAGVDLIDAATARVRFAAPLADGSYALTIAGSVADPSGNPITPPRVFTFAIDATRPEVLAVRAANQTIPPGTDLPVVSPTAALEVDFSEAMGSAAFLSTGYRLLDANGFEVPVAAVVRVDDNTARVVLGAPLPNGGYTFTVLPVPDTNGSFSNAANFTFTVNVAVNPNDAPTPTLIVEGADRLVVAFTEAMGGEAFLARNYSLQLVDGPAVPITLASQLNAATTRLLLGTPLGRGAYVLTIGPAVADLGGQAVDPARRVIRFNV